MLKLFYQQAAYIIVYSKVNSMDKKEFIEKAKKVHNGKYDYKLVCYIDGKTKVKIICPIHGEFEQKPQYHLSGSSCKECNKHNGRMGIDKFIKRANDKHGNRYNYSKSVYVNADERLIIVCKDHGEFTQTPSKHLSGRGCRRCAAIINASKCVKTKEQFIIDAKKIHGNRYDYSLVEYVNSKIKIRIICTKHGIFEQTPNNHSIGKGRGCPKCTTRKNTPWTTEESIIRAVTKHGNKYDYSKFEYINADTKSIIICPHHGEFKQSPRVHINMGSGCPSCNESKGEKVVAKWLDENDIKYIRQKRWNGCKDKNPLPFDFYIPSMNMCIEYDGEQHFISKPHWKTKLVDTQRRDTIKTKYCLDEGIKLLRINYTEGIVDRLKHIL